MKKLFGGVLFVALIGLTVSSCGKYTDGPDFSLKTKKGRLAGEWVEDTYVNSSGAESTPTNPATVEFERDGTYKSTHSGITVTGEWEFVSSKEEIKTSFTVSNVVFSDTRKILRLTNTEFWVEGDNDTKIYYVAK